MSISDTLARLRRAASALAVLMAALVWMQAALAQDAAPAEAAEAPASADEALAALLDVLRDDEARAALIAEIEAATEAGTETGAAAALPPPQAVGDVEQTLARRIADATTASAEQAMATAWVLWRDLKGVGGIVSRVSDRTVESARAAGIPLLLTILSTVGILWALTRLASVIRRMLRDARPRESSFRATLVASLGDALTDTVILAVGYAAGYLLAYSVFGERGNLLVEQSLYLNAFLIAGAARIVLRVFVQPDRPEGALSLLSLRIQRSIYRWTKVVAWIWIYGLSVIVPIANAWVNLAVGRSLRTVVVTVAAILALVAIRRIARLVRSEAEARRLAEAAEAAQASEEEEIDGVAEAIGEASAKAATSAWNRLWPWLASAYVAAVWFIAITSPRLMGELVWGATIKTLIACALIAMAFRLLRGAARAKSPSLATVAQALPQLAGRLDGFAPLFARLIALALGICAIGLLLDAWTGLELAEWLTSETGSELVWRFASAVLVAVSIILVWAVISSWIDYRLSLDLEGAHASARSRTLLALFRNAFSVAIFIFGVMIALSQLGIDIAPLLAGAGVLGLAIGFGSQKLVQDIITGVFIQLENAMDVGDVVSVGGISGAVEKLTIRSVGVRGIDGVYHIVPFSSVDTVSNFMRGFGFHVEVVGISYESDISAAKRAMWDAFERLREMPEHRPFIIGELDMHGVVALADSSVNLRARIRTQPGKQWGIGRAYTELVKLALDERGVEIPFPHRKLIISREDEATPALAPGTG